ncbi:MAG: PIN domain-containing protein [Chloroflexi bacterium]|nr:PIN domain-containing protein [Chloroflexota bacterium]
MLDTSTLALSGRIAPSALPAEPLITTITLAELSVGPLLARDTNEQAARQARLQHAETAFDPLPFDAAAARAFGRVSASLRRSGRTTTARAFDALIAAVALANNLPLYTCNPRDFAGIEGLAVVAVPHPDRGG